METFTKFEDDIKVEGITADHVWYNADLLSKDMSMWGIKFQKLVAIMEDRHKEHLKIIDGLLAERASLIGHIAALKPERKE
jgi:hypothetical protein